MELIRIFLVSAGGAFIQAVTGFGAAIFMMLFFSLFMPVTSAAAINGVLCLGSNISNSVTYRKHIRWKLLPLPVLTFFLFSFGAIRLAKSMDTALLKKVFGAVLILLSAYFLFAAKKLRIRPDRITSAFCGALSGITGGLFGASGPPMVLWLVAATREKETYLGTLQTFCLITGLWSFLLRLANRYYTSGMIVPILTGIAGVMLGQYVGMKVVHRISGSSLRTAVYIMLAVSGVINLLAK